MPRTTDQHTLAAYARHTEARKAAIARIEAIMLPGARALAGTRSGRTTEYYLTRERDLSQVAPFAPSRTVLIWRDQGRNQTPTEPYDLEHTSYITQVIVDAAVGPEALAELARLAQIYTAEIVRECESITAQQVHALDVESRLYQEILA